MNMAKYILIICVLVSPSANAIILYGTLTGHVTNGYVDTVIGDRAQGSLDVSGEEVIFNFIYNTDFITLNEPWTRHASQTVPTSVYTEYEGNEPYSYGPSLSVNVKVGDYYYDLGYIHDSTSEQQLRISEPDTGDLYWLNSYPSFYSRDCPNCPLGDEGWVNITVTDPTGNLFDGLDIPENISWNFDGIGSAIGTFRTYDYSGEPPTESELNPFLLCCFGSVHLSMTFDSFELHPVSVPEPSSLALLLIGIAGVVGFRYRYQSRQ